MHWYLVHTKPRQESCALQNLQQQGYACYLPLLPVEKLRQGSLAILTEPLFPRYLFIQLGQGNSARSWAPIRSTRGVNRLVSFGNEPAKIDDGLIDLLQQQETAFQARPEQLFKPGEKVQITEGAFAGIEGIYQMAEGERRVMVLIELLSKPVAMRISPASLRKVN
ncbi:transcription/translation regulatory transformer protein RfaH [uncultured Nitrosomonas sp.]|uniref:transcription/translation regulatory transformer protein RfaH n=1 Tax=uncultured Nitrosomonas sp. TaxID=156424 RepID=UPI00260BBE51|nr:transcription/translation regulatory transformer protein RfaH [uncultured Nitrosomonas sp.]